MGVDPPLAMEGGMAENLNGSRQKLRGELKDERRAFHAQRDETSVPVNGANDWIWVGSSPSLTVYHIDPTRGKDGAKSLWGGYRRAMPHDGWEPHDALTEVVHQMDPVHVNRWLQRAMAKHGIEPRKMLNERGPKFHHAGSLPEKLLTFVDDVSARLAGHLR